MSYVFVTKIPLRCPCKQKICFGIKKKQQQKKKAQQKYNKKKNSLFILTCNKHCYVMNAIQSKIKQTHNNFI